MPIQKIFSGREDEVNLLKKITHKKTVLQEMNYFPRYTMFLQIGKELDLKCIPGYFMLIFQAIASFEKYYHKKVSDYEINYIVKKVVDYISELSHVDTSGIESTSQTTGLTNVYRSDKTNAQETLSVEDATGGSENVHNNYFVVSSVLEKRGKK